MPDTTPQGSMKIEDYLAEGGILTAPGNAPPRYRAELLRLMATFVDSELAGAAGFADAINWGPGIKERIAASRIVLEKTDNADKVLAIMGEFGANTVRYVSHHPWTARLERGADIGATRIDGDMRLSVFNYPLAGWPDAVVMNLLMGRAVGVQLDEFSQVSYQPLAEAFRAIAPIEERHAELALEGLDRLLDTGTDRADLQASVDYWWPRVATSFGSDASARAEQLKAYGLRHSLNTDLRKRWEAGISVELAELGLETP